MISGIELGTVTRSASAVQNCAFARKATARGGYADRVLQGYVVVYVLDGTGAFVDWNGVVHRVEAGCALQMPPGRRHSVEHNPDGRWLEAWITLDGSFARALMAVGAIDETRPVLRPGIDRSLIEQFDRIRTDLHDALDRDLPATLAAVHALIVALHAADRRRESPDPTATLVERACAALGRDLSRRIDLHAIAAELELSYERFRKIFRQRQGISPGEYRIRRRIDQARALITQHRLSNKEIAYALGYADPFTFSKQFKQVVGMSPAVFRKTV
jgi:AraC family transcriptional regulator, arabinose operon regulatory protein